VPRTTENDTLAIVSSLALKISYRGGRLPLARSSPARLLAPRDHNGYGFRHPYYDWWESLGHPPDCAKPACRTWRTTMRRPLCLWPGTH